MSQKKIFWVRRRRRRENLGSRILDFPLNMGNLVSINKNFHQKVWVFMYGIHFEHSYLINIMDISMMIADLHQDQLTDFFIIISN